MAFKRLAVLFLVVMVMTDVMAARGKLKRKRNKNKSVDEDAEIADLKTRLEALENKVGSDGDGTCSGNKVHFFFHGDEDHSHEHDDDDTHVHVDLHLSGHDSKHGGDSHMHHDHVATCEMSDKMAKGIITIYQGHNDQSASFKFQFKKLAHENTEFEFHVHQFGDISDDCKNVGGHYDPYHDNDVGDLGTIQTDKDGTITNVWKNGTHLTMFGEYSILGRSMMVHDDHDHVSCCVIAVSPMTHDHDEDDSHSHDHSAHDHDHDHDHDHTHHH